MGATVGGVEVWSLYVPNGRGLDDPHYRYKLDWLEALRGYTSDTLAVNPDLALALTGDFNIAPLESDVWSHKQLLDVVSHTPIEVEALAGLQAANDWIDLGRKFVPAPTRLYTWWSYRAKDWELSNRGRRLDHMWVTPDLLEKAVSHRIVQPARSWERPSDHIPLITEFDF